MSVPSATEITIGLGDLQDLLQFGRSLAIEESCIGSVVEVEIPFQSEVAPTAPPAEG